MVKDYGEYLIDECLNKLVDDMFWDPFYNSIKFSLETNLNDRQKELILLNLDEFEGLILDLLKDPTAYTEPAFKHLRIAHDILLDFASKYSDDRVLKEKALNIVRLIHQLLLKLEKLPVKYYEKYQKYPDYEDKRYRKLKQDRMLCELAEKVRTRGKVKEELRSRISPKTIANYLIQHYHLRDKLTELLFKRLKEG